MQNFISKLGKSILDLVIIQIITILKVTIHTIFRVFGSQFYKDIKKKKWLLMKNRAPLHPHPIIIERNSQAKNEGN